MLKQIKNKWISIVLVFILVLALACVRAFEQELFADTFLDFFKGQFKQKQLPSIDFFTLFTPYFFRYLLNSILSLAIIYVVFRNWNQIKFASILYVFFFIILIFCLFTFISFDDNKWSMIIFYIRRFIIQPLFLILFLPAFYYQKLLLKSQLHMK